MTALVTALACLDGLACSGSRTDESPPTARVTRTFSAAGIKKVVLRADGVHEAKVTSDPAADAIEISGIPAGDAKGYHPADPNWKETPAGERGMDFVAQAYGPVLVISTTGEIHFIHHHYVLEQLKLRVPAGVEVIRRRRELTGDPKADLSKPDP
jgi:hypothetical protein